MHSFTKLTSDIRKRTKPRTSIFCKPPCLPAVSDSFSSNLICTLENKTNKNINNNKKQRKTSSKGYDHNKYWKDVNQEFLV